MIRWMFITVMWPIVLGCGSGVAAAAEAKSAGNSAVASRPASRPARMSPRELTVAILDFDAKDPGAPDLGPQIGDILTAVLSGEPGFTLVDRTKIDKLLQEAELNLTGVVDAQQAVKIGKLVGARILVHGRAFRVGTQMFMTAKLIGTETSLVKGVLVKDGEKADVGAMTIDLAAKLAAAVRQHGPRLVAQDDAGADPLPALKKKLSGRKLPTVAVIVTERHHARRPQPPPIDPAVETEIKKLLRECGFAIQDVKQNELADWVRAKHDVNAWPRSLRGVDMVVTGEAFSEFAIRMGNLISCSARVEINLIRRADGKIILADRATCRAVDLSENIAGKTALQKAGRLVALRILEHFAETLGPLEAAEP